MPKYQKKKKIAKLLAKRNAVITKSVKLFNGLKTTKKAALFGRPLLKTIRLQAIDKLMRIT